MPYIRSQQWRDYPRDRGSRDRSETRAQMARRLLADALRRDPQDPAEVELAWRAFDRISGGDMTAKIQDKLALAREKLTTGISAARATLDTLEAAKGVIPPGQYEGERRRAIDAARAADAESRRAFDDYRRSALGRVRDLRASAEAAIPSAERVARMQERRMLAEGPLNPEVLLEQAAEMVEANQPERADILLGAAREKGVRSLELDALANRIEDLRDERVPERKEARQLYDTFVRSMDEYNGERLAALRDVGIGIDPRTGQAGDSSSSAIASANVAAKMSDYFATQAKGETYEQPAEITSSESVAG